MIFCFAKSMGPAVTGVYALASLLDKRGMLSSLCISHASPHVVISPDSDNTSTTALLSPNVQFPTHNLKGPSEIFCKDYGEEQYSMIGNSCSSTLYFLTSLRSTNVGERQLKEKTKKKTAPRRTSKKARKKKGAGFEMGGYVTDRDEPRLSGQGHELDTAALNVDVAYGFKATGH